MTGSAFEPLWDIVEEHLDEAEFLWEQWESSLVAPNYLLREVANGPEARLMAHLDGLVVNGPQVVECLLVPTIADVDAEPTRVRAAALALLQTPGEGGVATVLAELHASPPQRPELVRALECCGERGPWAESLGPLLAADDVDLRHAAARVLAFHGEMLGDVAPRMLASDRGVDRALGLGLVPRLAGGSRLVREVVAALTSDDPALRDVALTAGAGLDLPQAWREARDLAVGGDPTAGQALLLLALRGAPEDRPVIAAALAAESLRGAALWALGFLGTVEAVDLAIPWLEDTDYGRLAGEVVAAVTGLDLENENLTRTPEEDPALEHRPEDDLPLPDAIGVLTWWQTRRARFTSDRRYVAGSPRESTRLLSALEEGPMRRRTAHLIALRMGGARVPYVEVMAPSSRQRRELAALRAALTR